MNIQLDGAEGAASLSDDEMNEVTEDEAEEEPEIFEGEVDAVGASLRDGPETQYLFNLPKFAAGQA